MEKHRGGDVTGKQAQAAQTKLPKPCLIFVVTL